MNYKVTLGHEEPLVNEVEVIVDTVMLDTDLVILGGFDPSFCPADYHDDLRFHSAGLKASIWPDSPVDVVSVRPTDEPVPEPEVHY